MSRTYGQRLKIIYLKEILEEYTDENTFITMEEILSLLEKRGVTAERKSIYTDIEALRETGMDIELVRKNGYRLKNRTFSPSELKLLVDAVQASKFITEKKSNQLIKKLESLTSKNNAGELQHSVIMRERIKTMNESVFLNVDSIQLAIGKNKQISFKYFEWDMNKNRVFRNDGKRYTVSPRALTWDDENYYLLAFDEDAGIIKHFRVDKMTAILMLDASRTGTGNNRFDTADYSKKMFGMFGGETKKIKLRCDKSVVGVFIDRFGEGLIITPDGDCFEAIIEAAVSPVFLAWLMQFGDRVQVLSPESVRDELVNTVQKILNKNS